MDKSWIVHGRQFTGPYTEDVKQFIEFVKARYGENDQVPCPCCKCLNMNKVPMGLLYRHIMIEGMSNTYTVWIHHGEPQDLVVVENAANDNNGGHDHCNAGHDNHNMDVEPQ